MIFRQDWFRHAASRLQTLCDLLINRGSKDCTPSEVKHPFHPLTLNTAIESFA